MNRYRCAVESCETDLKLSLIDNIISRLDSGLRMILRHDLLRCAEFALLEIVGRLASRTRAGCAGAAHQGESW
jgi:hypothetical protein